MDFAGNREITALLKSGPMHLDFDREENSHHIPIGKLG
jgi:hypothetical protein